MSASKAYMLVEETVDGLTILSHWDTLAEAVRNRYYNVGRHEADRKIIIFKSVTWHEEFTEVVSEPTINQQQDR
jgi:hypothetical protein